MNTSRTRRLTALAVSGLAVALAAPSAANAITPVNNINIVTESTGFYGLLDVAGGSTALGAKVIQYPATGGSNQRWSFVGLPSGNVQLVNHKSGMCLTTSGVAGHQLYMWTCNGGPRQEWKGSITLFNFSSSGGIYNPTTGLAVDIEGGSGLAGTRVIGWARNGTAAQKFNYVFAT